MITATPRIRPALVSAVMRYLLILCVGLGAIALFLLATASNDPALFAEFYQLLLVLNGGVAVMLTALVIYQLLRLRSKLRARVFGARLTLRLVLLFALMAVLPGALIYGMSVQFLARSIEAWFQVPVDKALEGGINLGRGMLNTMLRDLDTKADTMALALSTRPPAEHLAALNTLREQAAVQEVTLFNMRGNVIAVAGNERVGLMPHLPGPTAMRELRARRTYSAVESIPGKGLYLRVLVPISMLSLADELRVLQLLQPVPRELARDAEAVQSGYREYQELALSRRGLKRLYGLTLTLTLLLALLSAVALGFLLSDRLSAPLGVLVEGTRAVAQGDYSQRAAVASSDELGVLTQSFNSMTLQLTEARATAERHQAELAQAKAYLESIVANLSAGVLAFDDALELRAANRSAGTILGVDFASLMGAAPQRWPELAPGLSELARTISTAFEDAGEREWSKQVERRSRNSRQLLLLRGTQLPQSTERGYVVVFDDITHLAEAQRAAAWGEVARRLAHEIRNPLTPIQLSAERLQLKLEGKLGSGEADVLSRSTRTIVNQVVALKNMVDAFSQYARSPAGAMRELDINGLAQEVLVLYEASLGRAIRLELMPGLPPVLGDAGQLRQVMHNLLQNAQDALVDTPQPQVVVASTFVDRAVQLTFTDNGCGFPEGLMERAFEPYVTTKPKGTGLGLVIVKKIVEEHGGTVTIANVAPRGARITVQLPAAITQDSARRSGVKAKV
jgi:two-component system, NtrC family, nitrogen regulation sensor histidine kinase NtrY